jgi:hypothetical protein
MTPQPTATPRATESGIATALLVALPPLAALAAWAVPRVLTLAEHPGAWLGGIAATAMAGTALAAAIEAAPRRDVARSFWFMLLGWPLVFPAYMARQGRLLSGLAGAALLIAAVSWSNHQIEQGTQAAAFLLQASGEAKSTHPSGEANPTSGAARGPDGMTVDQREAFNRARVEAILDAEDAAR